MGTGDNGFMSVVWLDRADRSSGWQGLSVADMPLNKEWSSVVIRLT